MTGSGVVALDMVSTSARRSVRSRRKRSPRCVCNPEGSGQLVAALARKRCCISLASRSRSSRRLNAPTADRSSTGSVAVIQGPQVLRRTLRQFAADAIGRREPARHALQPTIALKLRDRHHHRCVIARSYVGKNCAACCARGDRFRRKDVVDSPADVALAHVAPGRPPGEHTCVVRVERAADIDRVPIEQFLEERPLLGALPDDTRLSLTRMHVDVRASDVDIAAQHDFAAFLMQLPGPRRQPAQEADGAACLPGRKGR